MRAFVGKLVSAALVLALAGCSPGGPAPGQPWDRAELVGYTYTTRDGDVESAYTFRPDDVVDATVKKGDAVAAPVMFWGLDGKGGLDLGVTRTSRNMRWTKVEARGDVVVVVTPRGRQEFRKSKGR